MSGPREQAEMLVNRLVKRCRHLRKWARRINCGAFRLYDRDIPEIPLALDAYSRDPQSGRVDAVSGALYRRPYEKDQDEEAAWLSLMKTACARALVLSEDRIFLKERRPQREGFQYGNQGHSANVLDSACNCLPGGESAKTEYGGDALVVPEGDLRFLVRLGGCLDTGLFGDRRRLRALVRDRAAGRRFLNLFCYTGSFSVAAAAGGAVSVDSVDMSNGYLEWAAFNGGLNGLRAETAAPAAFYHRAADGAKTPPAAGQPCRSTLVRADVLRFLAEAAAAGLSWDAIILDPPAFSHSKKMAGTLDLKRDHPALITSCLALLKRGGVLYFSAPVKGFKLDTDAVLGAFPGAEISDISGKMIDEDYRGRRIPACFTFNL
ncbi:MAG: class I SAM-dependent methyltransferase [Treponema sp.]|jgi:23S rRNA G2069 N7-methylase RlmK/C1962 C5-methylase RlmI|nr:class I SAM-dependent methyltransferase [Treponema sp.]